MRRRGSFLTLALIAGATIGPTLASGQEEREFVDARIRESIGKWEAEANVGVAPSLEDSLVERAAKSVDRSISRGASDAEVYVAVDKAMSKFLEASGTERGSKSFDSLYRAEMGEKSVWRPFTGLPIPFKLVNEYPTIRLDTDSKTAALAINSRPVQRREGDRYRVDAKKASIVLTEVDNTNCRRDVELAAGQENLVQCLFGKKP